jgi:hypothetical protein|tara:strand:- start:2017 stop:2220 length:204 start_codon:yes stop_codon:yes gene_type:complete
MNTEQYQRQQFIKDNIDVNLDHNKLIEEAEWKVEFYEKEVVKAYQNLELSKLAVKQLKNRLDYETQL